MRSMGILSVLVGVLLGCSETATAPVDAAPMTRIFPTAFGQECPEFGAAGCFQFNVSSPTFCRDNDGRCITIGTFNTICTVLCTTMADCNARAPYCTMIGNGNSACMVVPGDPHASCRDAGPTDAAPADADMTLDAPTTD